MLACSSATISLLRRGSCWLLTDAVLARRKAACACRGATCISLNDMGRDAPRVASVRFESLLFEETLLPLLFQLLVARRAYRFAVLAVAVQRLLLWETPHRQHEHWWHAPLQTSTAHVCRRGPRSRTADACSGGRPSALFENNICARYHDLCITLLAARWAPRAAPEGGDCSTQCWSPAWPPRWSGQRQHRHAQWGAGSTGPVALRAPRATTAACAAMAAPERARVRVHPATRAPPVQARRRTP